MNTGNYVIIALCIISLISTGFIHYIVYEAENNKDTSGICLGGSCATVQTSEYGKTFGIHNYYFGYVGFILLLIIELILIKNSNNSLLVVRDILVLIALLMSLRWLFLQPFVLHEYC